MWVQGYLSCEYITAPATVYSGSQIVLLLLGGDKATQERDIETAIAYWKHHQENNICDQ